MISRIIETLGDDPRVLRIARKLTQIVMWVSHAEIAWSVAAIDSAIAKAKQQKSRAA